MTAARSAVTGRGVPFTFILRLDEEGYEGMEMACADETGAIGAARDVLLAKIEGRPPGVGAARRASAGVGIGSMIADRDKLSGSANGSGRPKTAGSGSPATRSAILAPRAPAPA